MDLLIRLPLLALIPAALFVAFARWRRQRLAWAAAAAWVLYTCYELLISRRILCSGDCAIRVDLLLFYPLLGAVSLAALIAGLRKPRSTSGQL